VAEDTRDPRDVRDARLRVLQLLAEHRITVAEASELLRALRDAGDAVPARATPASDEPRAERTRALRVRITDVRSGRIRTNVALPVPAFAMGLGLSLARRFRLPGPENVDEIYDALRNGRRGTIVDVTNEHGERVEVLIE
jgi:hypothetical protein